MNLKWIKNKFFIAGALVLVTAAILVIAFTSNSGDTDKMKGTFAKSYLPSIGDTGTVTDRLTLYDLKVHFDRDPEIERWFPCVKQDDDREVAVRGRVRVISQGPPIIVTRE